MSNTNEGTGLSAELQSQVEELAATQQTQLPPQQEGQSTETTTEVSPELTALQKELAEIKGRYESTERNFKETQAAYTRSQQALRAYVGGAQPQASPVDQLAARIRSAGNLVSNDAQAQSLAQILHENTVAPLQQQLQAQQLAMHNQSQLDAVMQNAYQSYSQVMSDPGIYRAVENGLRQQAMDLARQGQQLDPAQAQEFAQILAAQEWGLKQLRGGGVQQQPLHPMQIRSQIGANGFYSGPPAQQQKAQDTPEMIALQKQIEQQFPIKK